MNGGSGSVIPPLFHGNHRHGVCPGRWQRGRQGDLWPGKGQRHEHREVGHTHTHNHQEEEHTPTHGLGSDYTLGTILGIRPCAEAIPIFLAASTQGVFSSLAAIGAWVVVTVLSMVGIVWLSVRGLETLRFSWLERYGEVISGAVITVVGIITLL